MRAVGRTADELRARCAKGLVWTFAATPFGLVVRGDKDAARRHLAKLQPHERALVEEFALTLARLAAQAHQARYWSRKPGPYRDVFATPYVDAAGEPRAVTDVYETQFDTTFYVEGLAEPFTPAELRSDSPLRAAFDNVKSEYF